MVVNSHRSFLSSFGGQNFQKHQLVLRRTSSCFCFLSLFYVFIGYLKLKVALIKGSFWFVVKSHSFGGKVAIIFKSTSSCLRAPARAFVFYSFHFLLVVKEGDGQICKKHHTIFMASIKDPSLCITCIGLSSLLALAHP